MPKLSWGSRRAWALLALLALVLTLLPGAALAEAPTTGTISGTVSSGTAPLAGVQVTPVDPVTYRAVGSPVTTGSDGTYTVSVNPGAWTVRFGALGYTTQFQLGTIAAGQARVLNVTLRPGASLSGTVMDTAGKPISGANLVVLDPQGNRIPSDPVNNGYFTLAIDPGTFTLVASAPGFLPTVQSGVRVAGGQALNLTLSPATYDAGTISGTLTDTAGQVPQGVPVLVTTQSGLLIAAPLVATDGTFSTPVLGGSFKLTPALPYVFVANQTVVVAPGQRVNTALVMRPGAGMTGLVIDAKGAPVAGAAVSLSGDAGGVLNAVTGPDGGFSFAHAPANVALTVTVTAPGFTALTRTLTLQPQTTWTGSFGLRSGGSASIAGVVTDASARPLPGARVQLLDTTGSSLGLPGTTTGSDGAYRLDQVPDGVSLQLSVSLEGYRAEQRAVTAVAGQQLSQNVTLTVAGDAGAISGIVVDINNTPLAGAQVAVVDPKTGIANPLTGVVDPNTLTQIGAPVTTGVDGKYTLTGITPGSVAVRAAAAGYTTVASVALTVAAGQTVTQNLTLQATGFVRGFVTDAYTNKPVGSASLVLAADDGTLTPVSLAMDGSFNIALPVGTYTALASAPAYLPTSHTGVAVSTGLTSPVTMGMAPAGAGTGVISGTVSGAGGRTLVRVTSDGRLLAVVATDASGNFTLLVPAGSYAVSVRYSDVGLQSRPVEVTAGHPASVSIAPPPPPPPASVAGKIVDATGAPVAGAQVVVSGGTSPFTATTGSDGSYTLSGLPHDLPLTMTVTAAGYNPDSYGFLVTTGQALVLGRTLMAAKKPLILTDLAGHWAAADVEVLVQQGSVSGFADNTFRPELPVTRAQFAKMIVAALAIRLPGKDALDLKAFTDADRIPGWGKEAVAAAVQAGLITGNTDRTFQPDQPLTRAQAAVILSRALKFKGISLSAQTWAFTDRKSIPAWALSSVDTVRSAGLVSGFKDGSFRPEGITTRAQAAVMIRRLLDSKPQQETGKG